MQKAINVAASLFAALMAIMGVRWLVAPETVAPEFGMPYLDGLGRSTQVGDLAAFFIGLGLMILMGLTTRAKPWFYSAALLLGATALFRIVAWLAHDAVFAAQQIAVEIVGVVIVLAAAAQTDKSE